MNFKYVKIIYNNDYLKKTNNDVLFWYATCVGNIYKVVDYRHNTKMYYERCDRKDILDKYDIIDQIPKEFYDFYIMKRHCIEVDIYDFKNEINNILELNEIHKLSNN